MKTYPLLESQMSIWLGWSIHPTATAWNLPSVLTFPKNIDANRLEKAVRSVITQRQELHIRFLLDKQGIPRQVADTTMEIPVIHRQLTEKEAEDYITNDFVRPFEPYGRKPLCRFEIIETPQHHLLLCDIHHSIADGTTIARNLIGKDLPEAYDTTITSNDCQHTETPLLFRAAQKEKLVQKGEYYRQTKALMLEKFGQTIFTKLSAETTHPWGRSLIEVQRMPMKTVDEWCRQAGVTPQMLFTAAFSCVLAKLCRQQEVAFFVLNHGRTDHQLKDAYGMFVRSLPVKIATEGNMTVRELIDICRREWMSTFRHSIYPSTHFCRDLNITPGITFGFQGTDIQETTIVGGEHITGRQLNHGAVCNDLNCMVYVKEGNYEIRIDSSEALNSRTTLRMVAKAVETCVERMMTTPDTALKDIALVNDDERQRLITLGQGERLEYDDTKTWLQLFEEQVRRTPHTTAIVSQNGSLTYQELDELASDHARKIAMENNQRTPFVAVKACREKEFMVQIIGIWKAGYAYVPIDPDWPKERQQQILNDIHFPSCSPPPERIRDKGSLAYMMYTSGSTGKPKGVMITHKGLLNLTHFIVRHWHLTRESCISCHAPLTFDASVEDLFPVLTVGGTLHIIPDKVRMNLSALARYLRENGITGGCYTTRLGIILAENHKLNVDYLCLGGERLIKAPHLKEFIDESIKTSLPLRRERVPRLINTYGPTECTVDATFHELEANRKYAEIPIGRPIDNLSVFITDLHGKLLPQGATGELWITGCQVAAGYWQQPQLTEEKFVHCDFCNERAYRTGDLVRWNEEGLLEFVGRTDTQVKRRGFRIEPAEIECALLHITGIRQAVVIPLSKEGNRLCAYFTAHNQMEYATIRKQLKQHLPAYMLPDELIQLEEIPLTVNGKVDIEKLPQPQTTEKHHTVPANEAERLLCAAFAKVLETEEVGATDNFFDCGGTSLSVMLLLGETEKQGFRLTYQDIFNRPTPRELASLYPDLHQKEEAVTFIHKSDKEHERVSLAVPSTRSPMGKVERVPCGKPERSFLLTGATGFLGIHILHELLKQKGGNIYCLVRDKDGIMAEKRLRDAYRRAFRQEIPLPGPGHSEKGAILHIITGDLTDENLLSENNISVGTVIHCAADVRHFAPGNILDKVNVEGTQNVIHFCLRNHARLLFISTSSLNKSLSPQPISFNHLEATLDALPYLHSKRTAEKLIKAAMTTHGLDAQIIRVGNLTPQKLDICLVKRPSSNAFMGFLHLLLKTSTCSESLSKLFIDISPVDRVAQEIIGYIKNRTLGISKDIITLQTAPPRPVSQLIEAMNRQGAHVRIISDQEFLRILHTEKDHSYEACMLFEWMNNMD